MSMLGFSLEGRGGRLSFHSSILSLDNWSAYIFRTMSLFFLFSSARSSSIDVADTERVADIDECSIYRIHGEGLLLSCHSS